MAQSTQGAQSAQGASSNAQYTVSAWVTSHAILHCVTLHASCGELAARKAVARAARVYGVAQSDVVVTDVSHVAR